MILKSLKSKSTAEADIKSGDMIEVYTKDDFDENDSWSTPTIIMPVDKDARTVTVRGKCGKRAFLFEDFCLAIPNNHLRLL